MSAHPAIASADARARDAYVERLLGDEYAMQCQMAAILNHAADRIARIQFDLGEPVVGYEMEAILTLMRVDMQRFRPMSERRARAEALYDCEEA